MKPLNAGYLGLAMCNTPGAHCGFASFKAADNHKKETIHINFLEK
jgi:hypothetical protein